MWVTAKKLFELTGITIDASNKKRQRGVWPEGLIWRRAEDGRVYFNLDNVMQWISGELDAA